MKVAQCYTGLFFWAGTFNMRASQMLRLLAQAPCSHHCGRYISNYRERNIILCLKEIEWVGLDRVHLAQDKSNWRTLVSMLTDVRGARKFLSIWELNDSQELVDSKCLIADPDGCAVKVVGLWFLVCWDCGFESRRGHGCLSCVSVVCCQVEVFRTSRSLVQRSTTECGVCACVISKPQ